MLQGMINIPLIEDELAVRVVAYQFDNSGYIDNVAASNPTPLIEGATTYFRGAARDKTDVGSDKYTGYRVTALWQPIEHLSMTLGYAQQEIEQDGFAEINLDLPGDFQQSRLGVGAQGAGDENLNNDINITNLVINYDLGWGELVSSSSWIDHEAPSDFDASFIIDVSFFFTTPAGFPWTSANELTNDVFVEELRLSSQFDGPFQMLAGLYYEDRERDQDVNLLWSGDPALESMIATAFGGTDSINSDIGIFSTEEQKAIFGEMSYDISETLTATVGVRYFEYDQTQRTITSGLLAGGFSDETIESTDSGQTYKANLSYTPNENSLIYGQWAEGFRIGGVQNTLLSNCDPDQDRRIDYDGVERVIPDNIEPDNLDSFEFGLKTASSDNRVVFNAAIYRINWDGIPVLETADCGSPFFFNAGKSKSEGIELEIQANITEGLKLDFSASYGEAILKEDVEGLGNKGDNLPGSADYNFTAGLEYDFILGGLGSFARIDYSYISEYYQDFDEDKVDPTAQASGGFGQINIKAGVELNDATIDVFVKNLTNADDFTWVEASFSGSTSRAYRIRPRTIGLNLTYQF